MFQCQTRFRRYAVIAVAAFASLSPAPQMRPFGGTAFAQEQAPTAANNAKPRKKKSSKTNLIAPAIILGIAAIAAQEAAANERRSSKRRAARTEGRRRAERRSQERSTRRAERREVDERTTTRRNSARRIAQEQAPPPGTRDDEQAGSTSEAPEALRYPVLFTSQALLRKTGIFIQGYGERDDSLSPLKHRCYKEIDPANIEEAPFDGMYDLSISDKALARARAHGFSLRSFCLGVHSGIRFDPGTGQRLPTFVLLTPEWVATGTSESLVARTDQLPFVLPLCFSRGLPYGDCTFNFDPVSGDRLDEAVTARYRELGAAIEKDIEDGIASGRYEPSPPDKNGWKQMGACLHGHFVTKPGDNEPDCNDVRVPAERTEKIEYQSRIDVSPEFPKGYGYAIYAPWPGNGPAPTKPENAGESQNEEAVANEARTSALDSVIASFWGLFGR